MFYFYAEVNEERRVYINDEFKNAKADIEFLQYQDRVTEITEIFENTELNETIKGDQ